MAARSSFMIMTWIGVLLIIAGVTMATIGTAKRGRLSGLSPDQEHPVTLEPQGRGDRLNLFSDLPGIGLMVAGAVILLLQAI